MKKKIISLVLALSLVLNLFALPLTVSADEYLETPAIVTFTSTGDATNDIGFGDAFNLKMTDWPAKEAFPDSYGISILDSEGKQISWQYWDIAPNIATNEVMIEAVEDKDNFILSLQGFHFGDDNLPMLETFLSDNSLSLPIDFVFSFYGPSDSFVIFSDDIFTLHEESQDIAPPILQDRIVSTNNLGFTTEIGSSVSEISLALPYKFYWYGMNSTVKKVGIWTETTLPEFYEDADRATIITSTSFDASSPSFVLADSIPSLTAGSYYFLVWVELAGTGQTYIYLTNSPFSVLEIGTATVNPKISYLSVTADSSICGANTTYNFLLAPKATFPIASAATMTFTSTGADFSNATSTNPNINIIAKTTNSLTIAFISDLDISTTGLSFSINNVRNPNTDGLHTVQMDSTSYVITTANTAITYNLPTMTAYSLSSYYVTNIDFSNIVDSSMFRYFTLKSYNSDGTYQHEQTFDPLPRSSQVYFMKDHTYTKLELYATALGNNQEYLIGEYTSPFSKNITEITLTQLPLECSFIEEIHLYDDQGVDISSLYSVYLVDSEGLSYGQYRNNATMKHGIYDVLLNPTNRINDLYYDTASYHGTLTIDSSSGSSLNITPAIPKILPSSTIYGKVSRTGSSLSFAGAEIAFSQFYRGFSVKTSAIIDAQGYYSVMLYPNSRVYATINFMGQTLFDGSTKMYIEADELLANTSLEKNFPFDNYHNNYSFLVSTKVKIPEGPFGSSFLNHAIDNYLDLTLKHEGYAFQSKLFVRAYNGGNPSILSFSNPDDIDYINTYFHNHSGTMQLDLNYTSPLYLPGSMTVELDKNGFAHLQFELETRGGFLVNSQVNHKLLWFHAADEELHKIDSYNGAYYTDAGEYIIALVDYNTEHLTYIEKLQDLTTLGLNFETRQVSIVDGAVENLGYIALQRNQTGSFLPQSYITPPANSASFSSLKQFSAHIDIDPNIKNTTLSSINIPMREAYIRGISVNGVYYTAETSVNGSSNLIVFDEPQRLPMDVTIFYTPSVTRNGSRISIYVTGQGYILGQEHKFVNELVDSIYVTMPTISMRAPSQSSSATVEVKGLVVRQNYDGSQYDIRIYEGDSLIGCIPGGNRTANISEWNTYVTLQNTDPYHITNHYLRAESEGVSTEVFKVEHNPGGASLKLLGFYRSFIHPHNLISPGRTYQWVPGQITDTKLQQPIYGMAFTFLAGFDNIDRIKPENLIMNDEVFSSPVVFRITTQDGKVHCYAGVRYGNSDEYIAQDVFIISPIVNIDVLYLSLPPEIPANLQTAANLLPGDTDNTMYSSSQQIKLIKEETMLDYQTYSDIEYEEILGAIQESFEKAGMSFSQENENGDTSSLNFQTTNDYLNSIVRPEAGMMEMNSMSRLLSYEQFLLDISDASDFIRHVMANENHDIEYVQYIKHIETDSCSGEISYFLDYTTTVSEAESAEDYNMLTRNGTDPLIYEEVWIKIEEQASFVQPFMQPMSTNTMLTMANSKNGGMAYSASSWRGSIMDGMSLTLEVGKHLRNNDNFTRGSFKASERFGFIMSGVNLYNDLDAGLKNHSEYENMNNASFFNSPCFQKMIAKSPYANQLKGQVQDFLRLLKEAKNWNIINGGVGILSNVINTALKPAAGWGTVISAISAATSFGFNTINDMKNETIKTEFDLLKFQINKHMTKYAIDNNDPSCMPPPEVPQDPVVANHDPAGFIYEAVASNVIPEAKVTLYRALLPNGEPVIEGDTLNDIILDQVRPNTNVIEEDNPLLSSETGSYQWFVPLGMWFVHAEKDGVESNDSNADPAAVFSTNTGTNLLPVLPIQLDVNIGLTSLVQPTVQAEAYYDAVLDQTEIWLYFSKYMHVDKVEDALKLYLDSEASLDYEFLPYNAEISPAHTPYCGGFELATIFQIILNDELGDRSLFLTLDEQAISYANIPLRPYYSGLMKVISKHSVGSLSVSHNSGEVKHGTSLVLDTTTIADDFIHIITNDLVEGATIRVAFDQQYPNLTNSTILKPNMGFSLTQDSIIKIFASKPGYRDSEVLTLNFTIQPENVRNLEAYMQMLSVTTMPGGILTGQNGAMEILPGSYVRTGIIVEDGYEFLRWEMNPSVSGALESLDLTAPDLSFRMPQYDLTLKATFNMQVGYYKFNLVADPPIGGTVSSAASASQKPLAKIPIVAIANSGYLFSGWTASSEDIYIDEPTNPLTFFIMPEQEITLTANFTKQVVPSPPDEGDETKPTPPINPNNYNPASGSYALSGAPTDPSVLQISIHGVPVTLTAQNQSERILISISSDNIKALLTKDAFPLHFDLSNLDSSKFTATNTATSIRLSRSLIIAIAAANKALKITSAWGSFELDVKAVQSLAQQLTDLKASYLDIVIKPITSFAEIVDRNDLTAEQKEIISQLLAEGSLVFEISIKTAKTEIHRFIGQIVIALNLPKDFMPNENQKITGAHLSSDGNLQKVDTTSENEQALLTLNEHLSYYVLQLQDQAEPKSIEEQQVKSQEDKPIPNTRSIVLTINSLEVTIDGQSAVIQPPIAPQIINDRSMLPFRYLIQTLLGGEVEWQEAERQITAKLNGLDFLLTIDSEQVYINGQRYTFDQAPVIVDGHTLVPLRIFEQAVEKLNWDGIARSVTILAK